MQNSSIKIVSSPLPTVVLFGRTNVGKSTLFNKLTDTQHALVSARAGTTRDSNVGTVHWQGASFQLIDTGGILHTKFLSGKNKLKRLNIDATDINNLVQLKVKEYLTAADLILFLVDSRTGIMEQDKVMALLLKRLISRQPVLLVANKADTPKLRGEIASFYRLSLGEPLPISATNGSGTGDLLDEICKKISAVIPAQAGIPTLALETRDPRPAVLRDGDDITPEIKVAIVGRPNVGKSTLLNAVIGANKFIVSSEPHTTREPNDITVEYQGQRITLMDTAGIIKAKSKKTKEEFIAKGVAKSKAVIKYADIALLVIDIADATSHQETKLVEEILSNKTNLIIVANKWDKVPERDSKKYAAWLRAKLPFVAWAPVIFLSAQNKTKINQLLDLILESARARRAQIAAAELKLFLPGAARHAPPLSNQKARGIFKRRLPRPKLIALTQTTTNPPGFDLRVKSKSGLKDTYVTYLENRLRQEFKLIGTPVKIYVKTH
ncbi:ribosome biogenesis GTPase Der [Candidatus Falkowbacteria bacterium RIFCSPHIGHO2_02_FULL_45_15]|uniref:GTPase Der n=2 Tax=Candidatus Falkowiibacteriota TaxID=1752728 RepID=A0A1F5RYM0_9BACT|nr:MAG: ribosome biogenesis GTPase Der [Candidatus Falkowbacteria bacterium RIFCSPHIGHO2_02_FULL_45_15]